MGEKINLPCAFLERMEKLLATEYGDFLKSYAKERHYGLRRNPLKASEKEFIERIPFALEPIRWAEEGYYYQAADQPGRHILHEAGAYYIQEPSAMAVVGILDPKPGEYILDLCAAPGGKSTQIAGRMAGRGLLVANEIIPNRARVLSQNIERMGIRNCVVCNETPERMVGFFTAFFDRIVVDAPCSGEGMFRKDDTAIAEWSEEHVAMCAQRQYGILSEAAVMLKPGGVLVYSTCTFAPDENEGVVSRFLREHEDFAIEKVPHDEAFLPGRPDWVQNPVEGLEYTMRLMPYKLRGEGHYIAVLRRRGSVQETPTEPKVRAGKQVDITEGKRSKENSVRQFLTDELGLAADWMERQHGRIQRFGDQIYLVPDAMISMDGMKVLRPGLHLGTEKKNRIEPSHALALAVGAEETDKKMSLSEEEAARYIHGESLSCENQKGWTLLTYEGYPLGFGKAANGQMKNHYPRGLRK